MMFRHGIKTNILTVAAAAAPDGVFGKLDPESVKWCIDVSRFILCSACALITLIAFVHFRQHFANTPIKNLGGAEDVADLVSYLASKRARFITGKCPFGLFMYLC